jgi:hypothetical protein
VTHDEVKAFMAAGRAVLTLESKRTGGHYTYRIRQALRRPHGLPLRNHFFVDLLTGPDNTNDFTYIGTLENFPFGGPTFRTTQASRMGLGSKPALGLNYLLAHLRHGRLPEDMIVRHEGRCGRCARVLTTPESIQRGIGPECWTKMGGSELLCTTGGEK